MNAEKRYLRGGCHCGNIRFVFITAKSDAELPRRECQCSFCLQHGRISTSDADGEMRVTIAEAAKVNKYRFGHKTADFYICQTCGAVPVVTSEVEGKLIGLVDARMIESFPWSRTETAKHDFDGEEIKARLDRRKTHWTGSVTFD